MCESCGAGVPSTQCCAVIESPEVRAEWAAALAELRGMTTIPVPRELRNTNPQRSPRGWQGGDH